MKKRKKKAFKRLKYKKYWLVRLNQKKSLTKLVVDKKVLKTLLEFLKATKIENKEKVKKKH